MCGPPIVRVDVEIIALEYYEAGCSECFWSVENGYVGLRALCVVAAAYQETPHDELMDTLLFIREGSRIDEIDWADGRMGLVVMASVTRP